jgi:hypothetical protein
MLCKLPHRDTYSTEQDTKMLGRITPILAKSERDYGKDNMGGLIYTYLY